MLWHFFLIFFFQDEVEKSKRVGFIKGLKETLGFKPYFYLLMVNIFSWLGFQASFFFVVVVDVIVVVVVVRYCLFVL